MLSRNLSGRRYQGTFSSITPDVNCLIVMERRHVGDAVLLDLLSLLRILPVFLLQGQHPMWCPVRKYRDRIPSPVFSNGRYTLFLLRKLYKFVNFSNRETCYFCNIFTCISFCLHTLSIFSFLFKPGLCFCYRNLCCHITLSVLYHPIASDQLGIMNSIMILIGKIS